MSLKLRLVLLSLGLMFALLAVGGAFQYFALGEFLRRDEASTLNKRFNETVRDVALLRGQACAGLRSPATTGSAVSTPRAECIARALAGTPITATVLSPDGGVVAVQPAGVDYPTLAAGTYVRAAAGHRQAYYLVGSGDGESLIALQPLRAGGKVVGLVQLSESTAPLQATQRRLLLVLLIATGALVLLALVLLPLLVARALRPLRRVTEASTALAGGDLARRVELPPSRDEVGQLARAFNDMASAVQQAVAVRTESESGMRRFVGDASHELRTPLTTIQGQLDMLSRGAVDDPSSRHQSLLAMQREVRRMGGTGGRPSDAYPAGERGRGRRQPTAGRPRPAGRRDR
jgi:two-component system OmpR family sensor kinase